MKTKRKLVHGEWVEVKIIPSRSTRSKQVMKVRGNGAYRQGALQAAKVSGKKL